MKSRANNLIWALCFVLLSWIKNQKSNNVEPCLSRSAVEAALCICRERKTYSKATLTLNIGWVLLVASKSSCICVSLETHESWEGQSWWSTGLNRDMTGISKDCRVGQVEASQGGWKLSVNSLDIRAELLQPSLVDSSESFRAFNTSLKLLRVLVWEPGSLDLQHQGSHGWTIQPRVEANSVNAYI